MDGLVAASATDVKVHDYENLLCRRHTGSRSGNLCHPRLGRTIADLDTSDAITVTHLSEAINYRTLDKQYWKG